MNMRIVLVILALAFATSTAGAICLPEDQANGTCGDSGGGGWPSPADYTYDRAVEAYGAADRVECASGHGMITCSADVTIGGTRYWASCTFAGEESHCEYGSQDAPPDDE